MSGVEYGHAVPFTAWPGVVVLSRIVVAVPAEMRVREFNDLCAAGVQESDEIGFQFRGGSARKKAPKLVLPLNGHSPIVTKVCIPFLYDYLWFIGWCFEVLRTHRGECRTGGTEIQLSGTSVRFHINYIRGDSRLEECVRMRAKHGVSLICVRGSAPAAHQALCVSVLEHEVARNCAPGFQKFECVPLPARSRAATCPAIAATIRRRHQIEFP